MLSKSTETAMRKKEMQWNLPLKVEPSNEYSQPLGYSTRKVREGHPDQTS